MKSRADVEKLMMLIFAECEKTRQAGQQEYAHDSSNALRNFEKTGEELGIPRERVWWVFAKKHWDGVLAWINGHRSQREDVRGRIKDLIVYLVLLWAMVDDEESETGPGKIHEQCEAVFQTKVRGEIRCGFVKGHSGYHSFASSETSAP